MAGDIVVLRLDIGLDADADAGELGEEATLLREELLELDVYIVSPPTVEVVPEGVRGVDGAALGALLVEVARDTIGLVERVIERWVARRRTRSVELTLDGDTIRLSNASADEQRLAVEAFLARHVGV